MTIVRRDFPAANAAEFSNTGRTDCEAVYNATGMIYNPTLQTCLFDDSWQPSTQGRRRLGASAEVGAACASDIARELGQLQEKQAAQTQELNELRVQQVRTNALLEKLLLSHKI